MPEKRVNTLSEFVEEICELNNTLEQNGLYKNEVLLFRGQSNSTFELIPSLGRNRLFPTDISILNEERNLIEMAKFKLPEIFHNDLQPLELLALLQHHGVPTRLLDVTENALVALYFACCSNNDKDGKDGEVFVFKNNELNIANYPIINAIADSYRFARGTCLLEGFYSDVISQPYFLEQKYILESPHVKGGSWIKDCCDNGLLFVHAPIRNLRQKMQGGRYILFPNRIASYGNSDKLCFEEVIEPIPKDHDSICKQIIIPKEIKGQILEELKLFGIRREILFADSVDIVCEEITKTFQKKVKGKKI